MNEFFNNASADLKADYVADMQEFAKRLSAAAMSVKRIAKMGEMTGGAQFNFERDSDVTDMARSKLSEQGITVRPSVTGVEESVAGTTKSGAPINRAVVRMSFRVGYGIYSEDHPWVGSGNNIGDKAIGIAITMGRKTFYRTLLMITSDDPSEDGDFYDNGVLIAGGASVASNGISEEQLKERLFVIGEGYGLSAEDVAALVKSSAYGSWSLENHEEIAALIIASAKELDDDTGAPEEPQGDKVSEGRKPDYWGEFVAAVNVHASEEGYEIVDENGDAIFGEGLADAILQEMDMPRSNVSVDLEEMKSSAIALLDKLFSDLPGDDAKDPQAEDDYSDIDEALANIKSGGPAAIDEAEIVTSEEFMDAMDIFSAH